MTGINFTDHIQYANPTSVTEKCANASEEFFNWSGHTVVVLNKGIIERDKKSAVNVPLVFLKFVACFTVIIPLVFLILRTYTRSVLWQPNSLQGRLTSGAPRGPEATKSSSLSAIEHKIDTAPLQGILTTMTRAAAKDPADGRQVAIAQIMRNMGQIMTHALELMPDPSPLTTKRLSPETIDEIGRLRKTLTAQDVADTVKSGKKVADYKPDFNDFTNPVAYHVAFANSCLGGFPFGGGAVQEELLLASTPAFAAHVAAHQDPGHPGYSDIFIRQAKSGALDRSLVPLPGHGVPDPYLMIGAQKMVDVKGRYYGSGMKQRAINPDGEVRDLTARDLCEDVATPVPLKILAMAAPKITRESAKPDSLETLKDLYHTCASGFALAKKDAEEGGQTVCHVVSGPLGCGAFHNDRTLVAVIQILAAKAEGVFVTLTGYEYVDLFAAQQKIEAVSSVLAKEGSDSYTIERILEELAKKPEV